MQVRLGQHHKELVLSALVNCLSYELAFPIEDETFGNTVNVEQLVNLAIRVK